jgi:YesN/AraC family two-component response regulator
LELAAQHAGEIDLLVTDVVMPEMDGRALSEALRTQYPSMKCLFISGYDADIISRKGILEPDAHFVQKPLDARELSAKVREALDADVVVDRDSL